MLRAAKKVTFQDTTIDAENSVILSPNININGLEISATHPVPENIKAFLAEKGFTINRVKYDGDMMLRIMGNGCLTVYDVQKFLKANILDIYPAASDSKVIADEIKEKHDDTHSERCEIIYEADPSSNEMYGYEHMGCLFKAKNFLGNNSFAKVSGSSVSSGTDLQVNGYEVTYEGSCMDDTNLGIFAQIRAKNDISIAGGQCLVQDALVEAGNELLFTCETLDLSIDAKRKFAFNPHPNLTEDASVPGRIVEINYQTSPQSNFRPFPARRW